MDVRDRVALSAPVITLGRARSRAAEAMWNRTAHPLVAMVAVPLMMTAAALVGVWWEWPMLIFCGWWYADRASRWTWILTIEAGAIGAQWAYIGATALATWPSHIELVGAVWIAYQLLIAAVSYLARRQGRHGQTYPGY